MQKKVELGFGIMRFSAAENAFDYQSISQAVAEYMKGTFCYFDLHPAYVEGQAQSLFNVLVSRKYDREHFLVANKMPYYGINSYSSYITIFNEELNACGVNYFDYYMLHAVTEDVYRMHTNYGAFDFLISQKGLGTIRNIGISYHDSPELLERILQEHKELDFVQLQINFYDWDDPVINSKRCYDVARRYGKKIIVMEPIKGGSLARNLVVDGVNYTPSILAEISLRFVATLPGIDVVLSGMKNSLEVQNNRFTLKNINQNTNQIDFDFLRLIKKQIECKKEIQCTSCGYCKRECPKNIVIPDIIHLLNEYKNVSNEKNGVVGGSISIYRGIVFNYGKASDCIKCGKCEKRCPQKINIIRYMKEAAQLLEDGIKNGYTTERNSQILLYLMKEHGIKRVIISPGATNVCFVQSVQSDDFFELYSAPDERSAAYMACGLAEESGEPVALSCTGATASRNYVPGLTEAFYRRIPVLAITSSQPRCRIGHNIPQMIDRRTQMNDITRLSVELPTIKDFEDEWECNVNANKALLMLKDFCGPVHIDLVTKYTNDFSVRELPPTRVIKKYVSLDNVCIPKGKIAIFCGIHSRWEENLVNLVEMFCKKFNAVLIQDHTGNYHGEHGIKASLIMNQEKKHILNEFDLIIHIGNVSGAYFPLSPKQVWRINKDGEVCDTFHVVTKIFEMTEENFFNQALLLESQNLDSEGDNIDKWKEEDSHLRSKLMNVELPFSNAWVAKETSINIPNGAALHLGILNSLRNWNLFNIPDTVDVFANTGGFGIDGCVSSLIGASLSDLGKLYFGVIGDLAFFYDMNAIGNRHVGNNLRIMVINNGCGTEFMNYNHMTTVLSGKQETFIAAGGHNGNKSPTLIRDYAKALGFDYKSATNKIEYTEVMDCFLDPNIGDRSLIVEIFTESVDESDALRIINQLNGQRNNQKSTKVHIPAPRINKLKQIKEVIPWGTGVCFRQNVFKIQQYYNVKKVCDNNSNNWGKEIVPGVICISPEQLKEIDNPFVIIMLENGQIGFNVANQLLDMGISNFDLYSNWSEYAKAFFEVIN